MAAAPILSLPLEIISLILQTLPNADHLLSAACSHSLFYQTIKEHEEAICDAVSLNTMDEYIYPYALGAASIRSRPFDYDFICNVLSDVQFRTYNFPSRGSVNFKCESNLRSALYINNLAKSAAYFSFRFEDETMPRADVDLKLGRRDMDTRATAGELYLIHRALFRYQIYCEIVMSWGKARGPDGSLPQDVFTKEFITHLLLGHLPPWVNEQLACVYDCLRSFFFPKYARVAKHDVEWGAMLMEYEEPSPNTGFVQGLMTYGLRFLEKVDKAQTYDEIRAALTSVPLVYSARGLGYLLSYPLDWRTLGLRPSAAVEMVPANDMEVVSKDLCLRACEKYCERMGAEKPWFLRRGGDPDPSLTATVQRLYLDSTERYPYRMWHLAMEPFQLRHCHYSNRLPLLRLCGYLLWDGCGDNVNVDTMAEGMTYLQSIAGNHVSELYLRAVQKHVSWRARTDVYMDGGRGYWSEDGVHRIEYTGEPVDEEGIARLAKNYANLTIPELPREANDEDSASETE